MSETLPTPTAGHRILLVDDDEDLRHMLRRMLVRAGHDVTEARNGLEALARQRERPAELVITDLIMPEKEGVESIFEIRRRYPGTKIIAISGGGRGHAFDYLEIARGAGAHRTLEKPFTSAEILLAIREVLDAG